MQTVSIMQYMTCVDILSQTDNGSVTSSSSLLVVSQDDVKQCSEDHGTLSPDNSSLTESTSAVTLMVGRQERHPARVVLVKRACGVCVSISVLVQRRRHQRPQWTESTSDLHTHTHPHPHPHTHTHTRTHAHTPINTDTTTATDRV